MNTRTIYCPGYDAHVPLGAYVKGVKLAKANPTTQFKRGITTWWPVTGAEIMCQFRRGMTDRINAGISYAARGI